MTESLKNQIEATVPHLEGWASIEKALAMADLIIETAPVFTVEIGVFGGRSLIPQAMAFRELKRGFVVGIDPWNVPSAIEGESDVANQEWWGEKVDFDAIHKLCMQALQSLELLPWARILRMTSEEALDLQFAKPNGRTIDIIHIDGNHSEVASVRNVLDYLPLVTPGGYVWFDDSDWQTTQAAVKLMDTYANRVKQIGNCVLFKVKYMNWYGGATDIFRKRLAERQNQ